MRHKKAYRKLGRRSDHRKAMLMNLTISLLVHEKIETTVTRAKELRKVAEKIITKGKKGTLAARRDVISRIGDKTVVVTKGKGVEATAEDTEIKVVQKLFDEIAPKYQERNGGYTRITKLDIRKGDSAEMAIIELV
ncbi:MAG: 50S ribosomal protein L17 [Fusobacteria bacterium]|nr:50S ribosomal protein L17 [Fusobacteriota bacterium]